jgi:hypothetical protein
MKSKVVLPNQLQWIFITRIGFWKFLK